MANCWSPMIPLFPGAAVVPQIQLAPYDHSVGVTVSTEPPGVLGGGRCVSRLPVPELPVLASPRNVLPGAPPTCVQSLLLGLVGTAPFNHQRCTVEFAGKLASWMVTGLGPGVPPVCVQVNEVPTFGSQIANTALLALLLMQFVPWMQLFTTPVP